MTDQTNEGTGVRIEELLIDRKPMVRYDPEEIQLQLEMNGVVEITCKPSSYKLRGVTVYLRFFGIEAVCPLSRLGRTPDEVLMRLRTINTWKLRKTTSGVIVESVKSMIPTYEEFVTARKLIENYTVLELLVMGMGYKPDQDVYRLMVPRLIPLVVDEYPVHVVQLTRPESAKTYFGIWAMKICGWFYTTAPPTVAGMFYDARSGIYGFAVIANGIVFDEVDKWNPNYVNMTGLLTYVPTFLENGVVIRPTSRTHTVGVIERLVNTIWFGNTSSNVYSERGYVESIFASWGDSHGALADRMTIVHVEGERIPIMDYVTNTVLPDTLMYAIIYTARKMNIDFEPKTKLKGRMARHSKAIQIGLHRLGIKPDPDIADEIVVKGYATALNMYAGMGDATQ